MCVLSFPQIWKLLVHLKDRRKCSWMTYFELVVWITSIGLYLKTTSLLELNFSFLKVMLKHIEEWFWRLLIQPTSELAVLRLHITSLDFGLSFCISYSLVSINMPMLDVVIHQNFPAEAVQIIFCKITTLNSLWFNKQSSEVTSLHDCTILHHP